MKRSLLLFTHRRRVTGLALAGALAAFSPILGRAATPGLVDDFSDARRGGIERFLVTDKDLGSASHGTLRCTDGVIVVQGELVPGRGVPAFVSMPLLLNANAAPKDVSAYEGVRLRLKVTKGLVIVQVASAEVTNFDFHASGPVATKAGAFQEVRIPFKDLKRTWSEQTPLNLKTITSVNLVAFGLAREPFAYEVDEIGFY